MNIGEAEDRSSLSAKTIRYYEEIGLVVPSRQANGYRDYDETDVHKLAFLHRARGLGFSVEECRTLLSLYQDRHRASAEPPAPPILPSANPSPPFPPVAIASMVTSPLPVELVASVGDGAGGHSCSAEALDALLADGLGGAGGG